MKVSSLLVSLIWLSARCQIPLTADLGKYLGVPLIHKRVSKTPYYHILEKVQDRLGWLDGRQSSCLWLEEHCWFSL